MFDRNSKWNLDGYDEMVLNSLCMERYNRTTRTEWISFDDARRPPLRITTKERFIRALLKLENHYFVKLEISKSENKIQAVRPEIAGFNALKLPVPPP